jgi:hypothetical protein
MVYVTNPHRTWIASSLGSIGNSIDKTEPAPRQPSVNLERQVHSSKCTDRIPRTGSATIFEAMRDGNHLITVVQLRLQKQRPASVGDGAADGALFCGRLGPPRLPNLSISCLSILSTQEGADARQ